MSQDIHDRPMILPINGQLARREKPRFEQSFRWYGVQLTVRIFTRRLELTIEERTTPGAA